MAFKRSAEKRRPPGIRQQIKVTLAPADLERVEAYCMRRATAPPYEDLKPSVVAKRAVLYYLTLLEAEEALLPNRRARPACVYASSNGINWCPEHDVRWEDGDEVPETCRGD